MTFKTIWFAFVAVPLGAAAAAAAGAPAILKTQDGGTGATTAAAARANLGAAASGANTDITSLIAEITAATVTPQYGLGPINAKPRLSGMIHSSDFGAICDGGMHPLSGVTSLNINGQSYATNGWSLAQWTNVFPSLSGANTTDLTKLSLDAAALSKMHRYVATLTAPTEATVDGSRCMVRQPVDWSQMTAKGTVYHANGVEMRCFAQFGPCFDLMDDDYWRVDGLRVTGFVPGDIPGASPPWSGVRVGRPCPTCATGNMDFHSIRVDGTFGYAPIEDYSSEVTTWVSPRVLQQNVNARWAWTFDGFNWGNLYANEPFVAANTPWRGGGGLTTGWTSGTYGSNTQHTILGGEISMSSGRAPIMLSGVRQFLHIGGYSSNLGAIPSTSPWYGGPQCSYEFVEGPNFPNDDVRLLTHNEGAFNTCDILFTSPAVTQANPHGLEFKTLASVAQTAVFMIDPGTAATSTGNVMTSVALDNPRVDIIGFAHGATPQMFDNPANYQMSSGHLKVPSLSNWGWAPYVTGELCTPGCVDTNVPVRSLSVNERLLFDAPNAFAQAPIARPSGVSIVTDGVAVSQTGATAASKVSYQVGSANSCVSGENALTIKLQTQSAIAATDNAVIRWPLLVNDIQAALWQTSGALNLNFEFWVKSSETGNLPFFVKNYAGSRDYTQDVALPSTPNTCQLVRITVPGYTAGAAFYPQSAGVAAHFGFDVDAGANWQHATLTWNTSAGGAGFGTSDMLHFLGTTAGSSYIAISGVKVTTGPFYRPTMKKADADALQENQQFYYKSVPQDVSPSANNSAGAAQLIAPYASNGSLNYGGHIAFPPIVGSSSVLPAVTGYSTGASSNNCRDAAANSGAGADLGALSFSDIGLTGANWSCAGGSAGAVNIGDPIKFNFSVQSGAL